MSASSNTPLHELDPEVAAAVDAELHAPAVHPRNDRLRELRAGRGHGGAGLGPHQQVRRGLPGPPLLRRLRARRRRRADRDRPGQGAVRRRVRQRPAALRRLRQPGRAVRAGPARRHHPRPGPRARRSPDPRHAAELLRQAVRRGRVPRGRRRPRRHGRGRAARQGAPPEGDHRGLVGLPAAAGLRRVPPDRGRGRGVPVGRHGALRRSGRGRAAPEPGPVRGRRHLHHPQDAGRPARRHHPRQEGLREEAQLLCLPGLPGRSPGARDRGQGGLLQGRRLGGLQGAPAPYGRGRAHPRRAPDRAGRPRGRGRTSCPAAPTCT